MESTPNMRLKEGKMDELYAELNKGMGAWTSGRKGDIHAGRAGKKEHSEPLLSTYCVGEVSQR